MKYHFFKKAIDTNKGQKFVKNIWRINEMNRLQETLAKKFFIMGVLKGGIGR
jgi:hypothetical protein